MTESFFANESLNNIFKENLERCLIELGDIRYSYFVLSKKKPSDMIIISNYPDEWVTVYKENNYQHIDPVVIAGFNRISPFPWDKDLMINPVMKLSTIFKLSKEYDVVNGYSFVLHDQNNNLVLLSFLYRSGNVKKIEEMITEKKGNLQMFLVQCHENLISLYQENDKKADGIIQDKDMFSLRENEVLYWASVGKTYAEIALILGIKVGTVKFHMGNVVKKLGVLNAKHAIRLGIEMQLIRPTH